MENRLWTMLSAELRDHVDSLVAVDHRLRAIETVHDAFGEEHRPGLHECMAVVAERYAALGKRFGPAPTPPLDLDGLTAKVQALPAPPAAIEAVWDGDTDGWFVVLLAITLDPRAEHDLAFIRSGTDLRVFNGSVPPWPEAEQANTIGRALAERLSVPFHFASPETPDDEAPRWWDHR
jgi:hypothetical protein